jgi:hypothetical protein
MNKCDKCGYDGTDNVVSYMYPVPTGCYTTDYWYCLSCYVARTKEMEKPLPHRSVATPSKTFNHDINLDTLYKQIEKFAIDNGFSSVRMALVLNRMIGEFLKVEVSK